MAVRFASQTQAYERTVALGSQSAYTVACWVRLQADRNTWQCVWCLANAAGGDIFSILETKDDGTSLVFITSTTYTEIPIVNLTVGTWYWVGVSMNGATGTALYRTESTTALTSVAITSQGPINHQTLQIGRSIYNGEWLSGDICAFKWWGASLSSNELANEAMTYQPQRPNDLRAWYPLTSPETTDYSGNGATLSGGNGATVVDGPPISWGSRRPGRRISSASPAVPEFTGWGVPI